MNRFAAIALLSGILICAPTLEGQTVPAVVLTAPYGVSTEHPADLALREWQRLGLTPRQVSKIQDIRDRLTEAASPLLNVVQNQDHRLPAGVWWGATKVDERKLRALFRETSERKADFFLRTIELGREVYELLDSRQRETLKALQREANARPLGASNRPPRPCVRGNASGGFTLSTQVMVAYSVEFAEDTAEIGVVWVGRGAHELHGTSSLPDKPVIPDAPESMSGSTMETSYLQYDRATHRAWLDTRRVPLSDDNVVLLDGIDRLQEPPDIVGTVRIPTKLYTGGCRGSMEWREILQAAIMNNERIRAFIEQGTRP
ncbi:MAG: hypothetical protein P8Z36_15250 [Gemmatimonadota bacterium]